MSRFFTASDSSSESSSEEELYSEEEEQSEEESEEQESEDESEEDESDEEEGKTGASKFLKEASDEEESEDEERVTVVKSAKDKRYEELEGTIRLIENAEKINDWAVISSGKFKRTHGT
jgi:translation initiation factor 3 subunit C